MAPKENSGKKPKFQYSEKDMAEAINAVRNHGMSFKMASKKHGVPRTTLMNKVTGKTPEKRKMGPSTVLTESEENMLVEWICQIARAGFPLIKDDLLSVVQKIVTDSGKDNPFTDNRPGRKWFDSFLHRHPEVKTLEHLTNVREEVTESKIKSWFSEVRDYLRSEGCDDALEDPSRILSCDETCFLLCPKTGQVLGPKGEKNAAGQIVQGSEKESLTVLLNISANGILLPPFIVYPYVRPPCDIGDIVKHIPNSWAFGKSANGWMSRETFFEYISSVFYPWLLKQSVTFPVILFMDGHRSHLSLHLCEFCSRNGIILVALPPNATDLLHPCNVSVCKPLKQNWKSSVHKWKAENSHTAVTKYNFAVLFQSVINTVTSECIKNGFQRCGISPFNADILDFSECNSDCATVVKESRNQTNKTQVTVRKNLKYLTHFESFIDSDLLAEFRYVFENDLEWTGKNTATELFIVWRKMKNATLSDSSCTAAAQKIKLEETSEQLTSSVTWDQFDADCSNLIPYAEENELPPIASVRANSFNLSTDFSRPSSTVTDSSGKPSTSNTLLQEMPSTANEEGSSLKRALFWPENKLSVKRKK